MIIIRSSVFLLGMVLSTLIAVPITFILLALPFPMRFRLVSNWARFNLWWLHTTCNITPEIEGLKNIIDQPAIIMCKHQSTWETLVIQLLFPPQVWILKRELLWIPIYGWGLATMRPIAIDRSLGVRSLRQIVRQGVERLNSGLWVVVFPEGTRIAPGERQKYHPGGGMLAEKSGCPVIPHRTQRRLPVAPQQFSEMARHHSDGHRHTYSNPGKKSGANYPGSRGMDRNYRGCFAWANRLVPVVDTLLCREPQVLPDWVVHILIQMPHQAGAARDEHDTAHQGCRYAGLT